MFVTSGDFCQGHKCPLSLLACFWLWHTICCTLRDLRIAEVVELDMHLENGKVQTYHAKVKVSFKYEEE